MLRFCAKYVVLMSLVAIGTPVATGTPAVDDQWDFDVNGYVDLTDFRFFEECFAVSGVRDEIPPVCLALFDADRDGDVDFADFAGFQNARGHTPIPLKDSLGSAITINSSVPYSPRQTCGDCHDHDADEVANGEWFQQGRTDLAGNVDMADDYYGDGRYWIKSAGRYGKWGQSFQFMLAAKDNHRASDIDQSAYAWVRDCSGCHSGGGPGEFDRDNQPFYDEASGQFGYELLGYSAGDVTLDGDYCVLDRTSGTVSPAPWDETGLSEPDCLLCHRADRTNGGSDTIQANRSNTLAAGNSLTDGGGAPVPAFAAASTAGQGWYSSFSKPASAIAATEGMTTADVAFLEAHDQSRGGIAAASTLDINYNTGVTDGSLTVGNNDEVFLSPDSVSLKTADRACVSCHPLAVVAGEVWFDDRDIHYRKFNNLNDEDPDNDIPAERSTVCSECHPTGLDHNAAKGNSFQLQYRNELDWENFRSCRDCHLTDSPVRHPDAPHVPGTQTIHNVPPFDILSCQACHIPYALTAGLLFRDITVPGSVGWTHQYYSENPLDPTLEDSDSRWYPPLQLKEDSDGVKRWFPASVWIMFYFGDWDDNGTPGDLSDDVIAPIYTWRTAQATANVPAGVLQDDDGDGRGEINTPAEILAYLTALRGNDSNGVPFAANPVLVRGPRVFYEDPANPGTVLSFEHEGTGIPMTSYPYIWGMDHNVLPQEEAWGHAADPFAGCLDCHPADGELSPVFDRLILVDPLDEHGQTIYKTVKELTDLNPHPQMVLKDSLGNPITVDSTVPYSPRQTCGGCHDHEADEVANGEWFQQGRTDVDGNVDMADDYYGDGRYWTKSSGRYGQWGQTFQFMLAAKDNTRPSDIDQSTFAWIRDCSGCHAGGGPGEFDRDDQLLYNEITGEFGYELLGKSAGDVALDGDYCVVDGSTGQASLAPWDETGLSEPDCLLCHREDRDNGGSDTIQAKRSNTLAAANNLVNGAGEPVPGFAAAPTAGQGWYSEYALASPAIASADGLSAADEAFVNPVPEESGGIAAASTLTIDYSVGVADGSLIVGENDVLSLALSSLAYPPKDQACTSCHPMAVVAGMVWFDDRDVHYAKFNNLNDEDPENDIPANESRVCTECHEGELDHNVGKGNAFNLQFRDELDYANDFRSCRECHLSDSPVRHEDAPEVPGDLNIHAVPPYEVLACQACHVPYALTAGLLFRDSTVPGSVGWTHQYYSEDPLNPAAVDGDSRWYPPFMLKKDSDGVERWFPASVWIMHYFGDWDTNGTPGDYTDDTVTPLYTWRVAQAIANAATDPWLAVTDADGDGRNEINTPEEILTFIQALKGNDDNGVQVAANPVLVRGKRFFYQDPADSHNVLSLNYVGKGIAMEEWYPYIWGMDHNVLAKEESWGYGSLPERSCNDCHRALTHDSPVFARKILVDPCDENGQAVYETMTDFTGLDPDNP